MRKYSYLALLIVLLTAAFLSGYLYSRQSPSGASGGRQVLYYVDPMNPGHKYDKPGIAPCGMQLEPIYADTGGTGLPKTALPPGAVNISPEKQQLIGVRMESVEKASASFTVRVLGRVVADETRVYRVNASADGWIRKVFPQTTGSLVKKNEPLAYFYTIDSLAAQQAYIYTKESDVLSVQKKAGAQYAPGNVQQYEDRLRSLGMTEAQIEEIGRTRQLTKDIVISSPVSGFVIARNVSLGQTFDRGEELYRIANLSRVWILLDTYENEAQYFKPGDTVPVRYQGKLLHAKVSHVLPQFDPATRTLKVRLELDNPGYLLRPDMFVDVEHKVQVPPVIAVPVDAVLDSGLRKTIFVNRDNGLFEPRRVETGRYFDERVEIVQGLMPGERIVVSGNFLLDSESRMRSTSSGLSGTAGIDPVCGMAVDQGGSKGAGLTSDYRGKTYFFCTKECKLEFDKSPQQYTGTPQEDHNSHEAVKSSESKHD
jgi:RND family efflux transporter MFP subunit